MGPPLSMERSGVISWATTARPSVTAPVAVAPTRSISLAVMHPAVLANYIQTSLLFVIGKERKGRWDVYLTD